MRTRRSRRCARQAAGRRIEGAGRSDGGHRQLATHRPLQRLSCTTYKSRISSVYHASHTRAASVASTTHHIQEPHQ
eukprot:2164427-Pyramimonas_sp.AAC.1